MMASSLSNNGSSASARSLASTTPGSPESATETMDQILKAKNMSSASVRRRKFQERQQQNALDKEKLREQKIRELLYSHITSSLDDGEEDLVDEMEVDVEPFERESSVETPSERSVLTPDESFPSRMRLGHAGPENEKPLGLKISGLEEEAAILQMELDDNRVVVPPSPRPVLQASLASWQDFRFDRYSLIMDSPLPEEMQRPELDTDESFSPIETATPISFKQPASRPSLISIASISQPGRRRTKSTLPSPLSPTAQSGLGLGSRRANKRSSTSSSHSAFPAAEATLFEVPDLPVNAFERIASASQESLPLSTLSSSTREPSRSANKAERKSSVPRLSTALSHARMSSIKSFIKTPTTASFSSRPSSHVSRPSTSSIASTVEAFPLMKSATFSTSSSNLASMQRPPTSRSISSHAAYDGNTAAMTALPSLPTPPAEDDDNDDDNASDPLANNRRSMQRKKSFSALRRRSESIGHAIKGLGKITTGKYQDPSSMVLPAMPTPKKGSYPSDLSKFPTPPLPPLLPSPRTLNGSAGSFTSSWTTAMRNSSSSSSSGGNVGLGLRSVDGLGR